MVSSDPLVNTVSSIYQDVKKKVKPKKSSEQLACEQQGSYWDGKTCVFAEKKKEGMQKPPVTLDKPEYYVDEKTKRPSGIVLPDGRTFLGLTPNDVKNISEAELTKNQLPAGINPVGTAQNLADRQALIQPGQEDGSFTLGENNLVSDIATGGAALGGAVLGAKAGAALGTVISPGIGSLVGGIIGGGVGAVGGAYTKLTIQKRQDIKEADKFFGQAKTNRQEILNMVNAGLLSEGQARGLWAEEKQNILSIRKYLKEQTQNDLDAFLGNPGDNLVAVDGYLRLDPYYDLEFENALLSPNPAKIRYINPETE